jgi:hypothetical protein
MKFVKHYLIIFVCNWKFLKSFLFRTSVSSFLVLVNVYEEKILFFLSALVKLHLTNRLNLINAESLSPFVFAEHVNTTNENVTELLRTFVVRFCTSKKSLKIYLHMVYILCDFHVYVHYLKRLFEKLNINIYTKAKTTNLDFETNYSPAKCLSVKWYTYSANEVYFPV